MTSLTFEDYTNGGTATRTETIDYDAIGNPLSYRGATISWYGRQMRSYSQSDVVAIYKFYGKKVVGAYDYDAWGNTRVFVVIQDTSGNNVHTQIDPETQYLNHIVNVNPIRYRGYYYDADLGLYYLQSRYYDSEIGRFINADSQISDVGGDVLGYNMFAYCMNNPVNRADPTGHWAKWAETTMKVVSAVVAVAVMVATVSAVSAGTLAPASVIGASAFLGAALSGINGGIANEINGNSYINGYVGGAIGGSIQALCSKTPAGIIMGGGVGVSVGTTVTDCLNNLDPASQNSTAQEIASNAFISGGKALLTSSLTAYVNTGIKIADDTCALGLMPTYTYGFGQAVTSFFSWLDDALVYIMG